MGRLLVDQLHGIQSSLSQAQRAADSTKKCTPLNLQLQRCLPRYLLVLATSAGQLKAFEVKVMMEQFSVIHVPHWATPSIATLPASLQNQQDTVSRAKGLEEIGILVY